MSVTNRRRSLRWQFNPSAKVELRKGRLGLGRNLVQRVLDMSETGVRLIVSEALEVGHDAEVLLSAVSQPKPLQRPARVIWSLALEEGGHYVGLNFIKPLSYAEVQHLTKASG